MVLVGMYGMYLRLLYITISMRGDPEGLAPCQLNSSIVY